MTNLWFIIYMTFAGWRVVEINPHPALEEKCYGSGPSQFCIVSVETPSKNQPSI